MIGRETEGFAIISDVCGNGLRMVLRLSVRERGSSSATRARLHKGSRESRMGPGAESLSCTSPVYRQKKRSPSEGELSTRRSPCLPDSHYCDSFTRNGFPGPDDEFREFQEFALADLKNDATVLDLSCGTGLFTRRIAKALPEETRFIAADYSAAMLIEAKRRLLLDKPTGFPDLVRVDVAKLPFASGSIDPIHCAAALHCYPRLEEGLREIRRVLSDDDGKFFATTFLNGAMGTSGRNQRGFRFFDIDELERLLRDAGFDTIDVRREGSFCAVIKAQVGGSSEEDASPPPSEEDAIPPSSTVPEDSVREIPLLL